MAGRNGYSPIQWKMLNVLVDGKPHTREELHACCGPSEIDMVSLHIGRVRGKLPVEYDIATLIRQKRNRHIYYVLVKYPTEPHPICDERSYP